MTFSVPGFTVRNATPGDRDEVLALTAHTWEDGEYIHWVYNDWVADTDGRFLVALDHGTGRIAAIDKSELPSPTEAWFEGLRVHPDFRGRGLAGGLQTFMIGEARRLGATVIRMMTLADNFAVHRMAYRDGFKALFVVRHWLWKGQPAPSLSAPGSPMIELRPSTPAEAEVLYNLVVEFPSAETCGIDSHVDRST